MKQFPAMAAVLLVTMAGSTGASAHAIYYTSLNPSDATFARYHPDSDTWVDLTPYATMTQMASDRHGNLYAYDDSTNRIQIYQPDTDVWLDLMEGPGVPNRWGNLEVTDAGRFLYTVFDSSVLHYSDGGGEWSTVELPFTASGVGDYDPLSNQYAVEEYSARNVFQIDVGSFDVTSHVSAGSALEFRRMGSILDGFFYENTGSKGIRAWDLSDPSAPSTVIPQPPGTAWLSSAVDRKNGVIYLADLYNGTFLAFEDGDFTTLAEAPEISNHSSVVFVGTLPEPSTAILLGVGLGGLALFARRERRLPAALPGGPRREDQRRKHQ